MDSNLQHHNLRFALRLGLAGASVGFLYAFFEHFLKGTEFLPLLIRATLAGLFIMLTIAWFETGLKSFFRRKTFLTMLLVKSPAYILIISFWLIIANGLSQMFLTEETFFEGMLYYLEYSGMYFNNLLLLILVVLVINILVMINSLHRPGELLNFVLGRYHRPREVARIFLFIDLNDSTTLAEQLGNHDFGSLLQAFYSDVSRAVKQCNGMIYDYIGDEVVISWTMDSGIRHLSCLRCAFILNDLIESRKEYYMNHFGTIPRYKAGMHAGEVVVMWVGDDKKEIVYLGDVLNTTKRIQTECSRHGKSFLVSGEMIVLLKTQKGFRSEHLGEAALKGKQKPIDLYHVQLTEK